MRGVYARKFSADKSLIDQHPQRLTRPEGVSDGKSRRIEQRGQHPTFKLALLLVEGTCPRAVDGIALWRAAMLDLANTMHYSFL